MSNSDISEIIDLTSKLLDLHDKDEMRSKAYQSAIFTIDRLESPLAKMAPNEVLTLRGIGKLMNSNIDEIIKTGSLAELNELIDITPVGLFEVFKVKGLGVKKIKLLWKELGIDTIPALKAACVNGTLASTKGFGEKSQESILESLVFLQAQKGKMRMNTAKDLSNHILEILQSHYEEVYEVGQVVRNMEVVDLIQFAVIKDGFGGIKINDEAFVQNIKDSSPGTWLGNYGSYDIKIEINKISSKDKLNKILILNANEEHFKFQNTQGISFLNHLQSKVFDSEKAAYEVFGYKYIVPEMREGKGEFEWSLKHEVDELVTWNSLKGTLHNHSTYSDGSHTLSEMANAAKDLGLQYFGIADHSQTAQYASGLLPETVLKQHLEIDALNANFNNFKILKGIESDILLNGDLDYEKDILASFDYVVASVHSVLTMDIEKATNRLLKAIENPYTSILGHLSGRLLLSRNGYPLHYQRIIDACAANKVVVEINASPYRLDIDWRWIATCLEKGVMLSINPDAHETTGLLDMHYGVANARKGGLTSEMTLNCKSTEELMKIFSKK